MTAQQFIDIEIIRLKAQLEHTRRYNYDTVMIKLAGLLSAEIGALEQIRLVVDKGDRK